MPALANPAAAARPLLGFFTLAAVLLATTGCGSKAEKQKGVASAALKDFRVSLDTLDGRIESSVVALERLQSPTTYDLPQAYQGFLSEHFNVIADANDVNQRAEAMRAAGADYYMLARKEAAIANDVKSADALQQRQVATREAYDALQLRLGELRESYRVYQLQLEGIRRSLSREQTRQRVAMISTQILEARDQATRVRTAIAATTKQTDALSALSVKK